MIKKIIVTVFVIQAFLIECKAQSTSSEIFSSLQSQRNRVFVDEKGQQLGCDGILECQPLDVVIYSVSYNKRNRQLVVQGNVYIAAAISGDTVRSAGTRIFLAEPCKDTLTKIRELGHTIKELNKRAVFPNRRGDFDLKFTAGPMDKLYFVHGSYGLLEYNIDKIVSGEIAL
jgi:hypothetical protein